MLLSRITSRSPRAIVIADDLMVTGADYKTHLMAPSAISGTSAPTTTPDRIGNLYVATSTGKGYIAVGTSSSSDWAILN